MIKVGQIYKSPDGIMVITQINKHINSLRYDYIYNDGMVCSYMRESEVLSPGTELIAEYPTWQEAINSKEFKKEEEEWIPLSELGCAGTDFDLIQSNIFLECVKMQGFVDDDGDGYPVIKTNDGTFLYNKKKSVYPSEVQNKDKLDFDYIAWFNK